MEAIEKKRKIVEFRTEDRHQRGFVFGTKKRLYGFDQLHSTTQVFVALPLLLGKMTTRLVFTHQGVGLLSEGLQDVRQLLDHLTNGGTGGNRFHSFLLPENGA